MSKRFAVIGAGPAGLMAARQLQLHGHSEVKVFEKRDRVGGKCATVDIDGRNYELGAAIVGRTTYKIVNQLIEDLGLTCMPFRKTELVNTTEGGTVSPFRLVKDYMTRFRPAISRYLQALDGVPSYAESGYLGFDLEEFGRSFTEWATVNEVEDIVEVMAPIYTGFGYGYLNQMSAAQVFKVYDRERFEKTVSLNPFRRAPMLAIREGFQGLWERVASSIHVELGVSIQNIERGDTIRITTKTGTEDFDVLILACPLDKVSDALDLSAAERTLFDQIRTLDYQTITAEVDNFGTGDLVFFMDNLTDDRAGHLVCGYRRWKQTKVWTLYALSNGTHDSDSILECVKGDLEAVGAKLGTLHRHDKWAFFPHVNPADFRAGFYQQLEALQGVKNTYITGEIIASASVESVSQYSKDLVQRFFAGT